MKKILFLGLFLFQAALMSAQYSININPFEVAPGASSDDDDSVCFDININYGAEEQANMVQFNMFLPEGISIPDGYIELDEDRFPLRREGRKDVQPFTVGQATQSDGSILVTITTTSTTPYYFVGNTGAALKAYFIVDANMPEAEYEIKIDRGIIAIDGAEGGGPSGITSTTKVTVSNTATGIRSINADGTNDPVYNTAGQRVKHVGKGLYIQNGKKVVRK